MKFKELLAKSYPQDLTQIPDYARLANHLETVKEAGQAICETVGEKILHQLNLNSEVWFSRLRRSLLVSGLAHDIGKANRHFQEMVRGQRGANQAARHELLSALLLHDGASEIRCWAISLLDDLGDQDNTEMLLHCVIGAVAGHHLKLDIKGERAAQIIRRNGGDFGKQIEVFLTHPGLNVIFGDLVTNDVFFDLDRGSAHSFFKRFDDFIDQSIEFEETLETKPEWRRFCGVLKALTAAADVAGSALVSEKFNVSPEKWISQTLAAEQFVTAEQMQAVVEERLAGRTMRAFQKAVAESEKRVTLVEAGCGTGKTLAAYAWAARHAADRKLFFCYPTTGTATEGFGDYVAESKVEAELIHSRTLADLKDLIVVRDDAADEKPVRIESLKMWSPQVIVCTADTVLALPRNNRKGIYGSPAILTASFVFDELHAYDEQMIEAVAALIEALPNAHFLLMTASLPASLREYFKTNINDLKQIPTPQELEDLPRYLFKRLKDEVDENNVNNSAVEAAKNHVAENHKVLWICNTVKQAQNVLDRLNRENLPAHVYHSRFKYEDRKQRHKQTVNAFNEKSANAVVAVTTQVAEMSLDLNADVLISEIAPVPALIQRLGRLNRRITVEKPGTPRPAYFYQSQLAKNALPYKEDEIETGKQWFARLGATASPISQSDLIEHFKRLVPDKKLNLNLFTRWLDSGWLAEPENVREDGSNSISVILQEDEKVCRASAVTLINKTIPMYYEKRMEEWRDYKGIKIAPFGAVDYSTERGAR